MRKVLGFLAIGVLVFGLASCQRKSTSGGDYGAGASDLARIHFDFDKSDIRSDAIPILERNAAWLKSHGKTSVSVEGHCDDRGTNEYNMALGDRRARAARDYLANLGIESSRLSVVSYGEERPLDRGGNETAWALNRRAEFMGQ